MEKIESQPKSIKKKSSKLLTSSTEVTTQCVQVVVRCRPMDDKEIARNCTRVVEMFPSRGAVEICNPREDAAKETVKVFSFDSVYDWNSTQQEIYEETVRPLVISVLDGFNGTIFAYGQTGTGKTYTMEGSKTDSDKRGIIPRSFDQIFTQISRSQNIQYLVRASYLEIYQEEIQDLLNPDQTLRLELKEKPDTGIFVKDLSNAVCKSADEIQQLMKTGNQNRTVGATNMNEHSSRSHAIFMITIEMGDKYGIRVGKLNLVDLAGSERQSKTGASGERLKEASKINLSLSALGNVISALVDGKTSHIPYRDSKLTRLLQDSLGGNSKTIMVANIGPASYNYDETLTTLRYANRAKNIKNKPRINEDPKDALLRQYQEEIQRLKEQLAQKASAAQTKKSINDEDKSIDGQLKVDEEKTTSEQHKMSEEEKKKIAEQLKNEKQEAEELEQKIKDLESKMLCGGKNIIDHTNEQQRALEQRAVEIAERKKREIEMQQKLEEEELTALNVRETYATLQQEVDVKSRKLRKYYAKLQVLKQDLDDVTSEYNRDRRDLEQTQHELMKELKLRYLIIDNFIPVEEKHKILSRVKFDEDEDCWLLKEPKEASASAESSIKRPVSVPGLRRPTSEYARTSLAMGKGPRYAGENILTLGLDMPARTTLDYQTPMIAPTIQAVLEKALCDEGDIDVDASNASIKTRSRTQSARPRPKSVIERKSPQIPAPVYPKTRGLVPK